MPKWLWWFLEPFTIPQYKLTAFDGLRAFLFIVICLIIIFGIYTIGLFIYHKRR